jgi:hypothetical protein
LPSEIADMRMATAVAMLDAARRARDPLVQAQIMSEAQYQLAWSLREAVAECQDDQVPRKRSWAEIGNAIGLPRETAWRQFKAGGPIVTVKPYQSADSPLSETQRQPVTSETAVYAFSDPAGNWFGPADALPEGHYGLGWLDFEPPNAPASRFAGQQLLVRHGPWDGDVTFHAPQIIAADTGRPFRIRATYEVIDWLFGDGQTALRQAMTKVAQATAITPNASPKFIELVDNATRAQNPDLPVEAFIAAAADVAEHADLACRDGAALSRALLDLERAVQQRRYWDERTSEPS